jgi:hypothetical protein
MTDKFYADAAFVGRLPGYGIDVQLLRTMIGELTVSTPVVDVQRVDTPSSGVVVSWASEPSAADVLRVDGVIAAFPGVLTTTSEPFQINSFAVATSANTTPVTKTDFTTPALDPGTYQVIWTSSTRMQAVAANTGVQADITLTRSDGVAVHQDDAWDRANRHAFNGVITFQVLAGQTIRSLLTFNRLGASGTAEMSGARITIDKIS